MPKCEDHCYEDKRITADPRKTLVYAPGGLLVLKTPLLRAFLMFVQNVIMYVTIVVFIVPNSNLHMSLHEASSFTFFGTETGSRWFKKPRIDQNTPLAL